MSTLLRRLLAPAALLMSHLSLRVKLLGMFAILIIPIFGLSLFILGKINAELSVAENEHMGVAVSRHIMTLVIQTQKHRGQVNLKFAAEPVDDALSATRSQLSDSLKIISQDVSQHPDWSLDKDWAVLQAELTRLANGQIAATAADSIRQHNALVSRILEFSTLLAEQSGLLLDPAANTYFLMDATILKIPVWTEHLALLRGLGAGYIRTGKMEFIDKAGIYSRIDALRAAMKALSSLEGPLQRSGETILSSRKDAFEASESFIALATKLLLADEVSGDAKTYFAQGTKTIELALALQEKLEDRLTGLLSERVSDLQFSRNIIVITTILSFIAAIYVLMAFYSGFMAALRALDISAQAVASGDLTRRIHIDGADELALTGGKLESMNDQLSALVANVRSNSCMVSQLGEDLASGISELSARTEQQASSLEQTSASVEDLADTVRKNADSATAVDQLASKVQAIAESSGGTMQEAVVSMQGIQSSALKVQDIISIIDGIAFQTNILALNAAVEAARAGEQGRGFAVVASEVRGLAQRSADSSRQIRQLIEESVHQVKHGVAQINQVNQTLTDIVTGIRELASNINVISVASVEQSNGLAQISEALHHLDEITQSNGQMADHAKFNAMELEERAGLLARSVSTFKLRQGTADEALKMVKIAVALYRDKSQAALSLITANQQQQFADRDMYVFAFDRQGQYRAFGGNAEKLKVNLFNVPGLNGRQLVQDAFALPAKGGWVDYSILNPLTQKVEHKSSYIERVSEELVIGCGVYKH
ncbi:methyl-accepting chemotaxis protein [Undibacterium crateris]|uniref:methyl-accepting chemotaxis protein n=1 Tax=Undibacterium crateris TaxID=2528175 RepID=UPI001389BD26|nr:methyl-accepting chemotaxis protein [Undibacterium crateris]NDI84827.1 hypothetical protein [Undibacterium crateris]